MRPYLASSRFLLTLLSLLLPAAGCGPAGEAGEKTDPEPDLHPPTAQRASTDDVRREELFPTPTEPPPARAEESRHLNVLWITAEDMSPDLGSYGESYAHTPNLDRLASQGARFTRAFSVSGVCAPSRSALITGMYPTSLGSHHMRSTAVPPAHVKAFPELLRAAGYYTSNNAKTDYNFSPWAEQNSTLGVVDPPLGAWDESSPRAHWRRRDPGQAFFAVLNLLDTHESRIRFSRDRFGAILQSGDPAAGHDPAEAVLPPYYPDTPEVRADWARYHDLVSDVDRRVGSVLDQLEADGLAENTIVFFFSDHGRGLPRAKRWLYDSGVHVPLIVRWPGRIEPGTVRDDLVSFVDLAPTVLSLAGAPVPSSLQGRVFLGAGTEPAPEFIFAARDRIDEAYDTIRAVRDGRWKYIRNFEPQKAYAQPIAYRDQMATMRSLRQLATENRLDATQRLFLRSTKPPDELYDTTADPHEVEDLAGAPEHRERLARMRRALETWMKETGDLGLIPEAELVERMRPGGVFATTEVPRVKPSGGKFRDPVTVRLSAQTAGSSIVYTTDQTPRARWRLYTEPLRLSEKTVLRVKASRLGYYNSPEESFVFEVGDGTQDAEPLAPSPEPSKTSDQDRR